MNLKIMDSDSVRTQSDHMSASSNKRDWSIECKAFRCDWHLRIVPSFWLIMIIIISVTFSLGIWQLERKAQKTAELEQQTQQIPPRKLTGYFVPPRLFLDNQTHQGKVGYEIIEGFQTNTQTTPILINRGWIAAPTRRSELPDIPQISDNSLEKPAVNPLINPLVSRQVSLVVSPANWSERTPPDNVEAMAKEQYRIQAINAETRNTLALPTAYFKAVSGDGVLTTDHWQAQQAHLEISPKRHLGYAIQWFALACIATGILLISSISVSPQLQGEKPHDH